MLVLDLFALNCPPRPDFAQPTSSSSPTSSSPMSSPTTSSPPIYISLNHRCHHIGWLDAHFRLGLELFKCYVSIIWALTLWPNQAYMGISSLENQNCTCKQFCTTSNTPKTSMSSFLCPHFLWFHFCWLARISRPRSRHECKNAQSLMKFLFK